MILWNLQNKTPDLSLAGLGEGFYFCKSLIIILYPIHNSSSVYRIIIQAPTPLRGFPCENVSLQLSKSAGVKMRGCKISTLGDGALGDLDFMPDFLASKFAKFILVQVMHTMTLWWLFTMTFFTPKVMKIGWYSFFFFGSFATHFQIKLSTHDSNLNSIFVIMSELKFFLLMGVLIPNFNNVDLVKSLENNQKLHV